MPIDCPATESGWAFPGNGLNMQEAAAGAYTSRIQVVLETPASEARHCVAALLELVLKNATSAESKLILVLAELAALLFLHHRRTHP